VAETIAYPEDMSAILPVIDEGDVPHTAPVKKRILKTKKLTEDLKEAEEPKPKPATAAAAQSQSQSKVPKVPSEAPPKATKPRIRKVEIQAQSTEGVVKRGRGRPKGSLGKKKRDLILEEEFRRVSAVEL